LIYVDLEGVTEMLPSDWIGRAQSITDQLKRETDVHQRAKIISDNSSMWRELKGVLSSFTNEKCWYCETREIRSDNAVDHFRPKGSVASESHFGYWWLAFDYKNFRFSCTFCNSRRVDVQGGTAGGKQDSFPLLPGSSRMQCPDDDTDLEYPALLDPCCIADINILWFDDNGGISVNPSLAGLPAGADRVAVSVELYHLDHARLAADRRRIYLKIGRLLRAADLTYRRWKGGEYSAKASYEALLLEIRSLALRDAEHSATARCALLGFRVSSGAAEAVLRFL
jgi:hypothetical protein